MVWIEAPSTSECGARFSGIAGGKILLRNFRLVSFHFVLRFSVGEYAELLAHNISVTV